MEALISHLRGQCSWLSEVMLNDGGASFGAPLWLRAGATAVIASEQRPIVLVSPFTRDSARWTALVCALESFRSGFDERVSAFCGGEPQIGARVVIQPENKYFFYQGTKPDGQVLLRCADGNQLSMRLSRLRIRAEAAGGAQGRINSLHRHPASHPFAELLACDPLGNHEIFGDGVVLIDSKSGIKDFASRARISRRGQTGVFHDFDPKGHLLKVYRTALDFVDSNPVKGTTVIVNGARRLETLAELHKLVGPHRLVIFATPDDLTYLKRLEGNADFWFFQDDPWLMEGSDETSVRCTHLAHGDWSPQLAANQLVESAASQLGKFCALMEEADDSTAQGLRGPAWGLLLEASSRTRGYSENQRRAFQAQLDQFRQAISTAMQSLTPEMQQCINEAFRLLTELVCIQGATNSKGILLHELVHGAQRVAIITRTENEAVSVRGRFVNVGNSLHILAQSELPLSACYDCVIVCGWLGARAMAQLYSSGAARRLRLIGYSFEIAWLKSLTSRLVRREGIGGANANDKLDIVKAPESLDEWPHPHQPPTINWPTSIEVIGTTQEPSDVVWNGIDIWDFEYRITHQRKEPLLDTLGAQSSIDLVPVRYVSFKGTGYTFFTTDRNVPVITELLREGSKAIKPRRVLELQLGDLVVFPRLGGSDLIVDVADKLLQGRADRLRMTANQYARQLQSSHLTPEQFRAKAQGHGLTRSLAAVRDWFAGSRVIGPDSDEDIEIIQRVVGGTTWACQCIEARRELRQAHATAEGRIREALLLKLRQNLDQIEACGCQLELGELGSVWVQCVESVSEQAEEQPKSKTNRLLGVA